MKKILRKWLGIQELDNTIEFWRWFQMEQSDRIDFIVDQSLPLKRVGDTIDDKFTVITQRRLVKDGNKSYHYEMVSLNTQTGEKRTVIVLNTEFK